MCIIYYLYLNLSTKTQSYASKFINVSNQFVAEKNPVKSVNLLVYRSHPVLKISDHKPVSALFDVKVSSGKCCFLLLQLTH